MYGLETTVLLPLIAGVTVHSGRPFFPEDIRSALAEVPAPRILVSTPTHLQVCLAAALEWPAIECVISATAPLSKLLAADVEQALRTRVMEIYGCTEAGSIASRRTVEGDLWRSYDGLALHEIDGAVHVSGAPLPDAVPLTDVLRLHGTTTLQLLGRHSDMVNIAGKRASLAELNIRLTEIDGVVDGIFIVPESSADSVTRLVALVVAPDLSEHEILAALASRIDPVFLPRPLRKVEVLPRTDSGKLPKEALAEILAQIDAPRRINRQ
jgi:acyl-coenzyme A synthetase/AMP-(fatty) acid ligase